MREVVVSNFIELIRPYLNNIDKIAVVGGSINEPELEQLKKFKKFSVKTYGIDKENDFFLDLNLQTDLNVKYDLILCSQVFEHLYDIKNGLMNLAKFMDKDSLLWIGCPASNKSHGSPEYFSAGYQPEIIINLSRDFSLQAISFGKLGTKRNYFMTHALRIWPSAEELKHPLFKYDFSRLPNKSKLNILRFFRDLPGRIYALFIENNLNDKVEYATETYVLLRKQK
jgi:SAM-dependent methyltransferase